MGMLILILLGLGLWEGSFLIMGIALALLILLTSSEASMKSWLHYVVSGVIMLFLLLLLLALILDLEWKPRTSQLQIYELPEDRSPIVELHLPRLVLAGGEPVTGSVSLLKEMASSGPITVVLALPSALSSQICRIPRSVPFAYPLKAPTGRISRCRALRWPRACGEM